MQASDPLDPRAVARARRDRRSAGGDEGTALGSNKGIARYEEQAMT